MDGASLRALEEAVRPVEITGALTLEQAATAVRLNREVARFHAAVAQVRRIDRLAGVVDERMEDQLLARAGRLVRARDALAGELPHAADRGAQA